MAKVLAHDVHVTDEKYRVVVLRAGDTVPRKLQKYVTNPKAYIDGDPVVAAPATPADDAAQALRDELKKRELPTDGSLEELRERIATDDAEAAEQEGEE